MIDEEATYKKFGYKPSDLKPESAKKVVVICDDCGKVRDVKKYSYRTLCKACARKGAKNSSWKGGETKKICETCGKEFEVGPFRKDTARFCSLQCFGEWTSKYRKGAKNPLWKRTKRLCKQCGKELSLKSSRTKKGRGKFCSRECYSKWRRENITGEEHPSWKGGKVKQLCEHCGKELLIPPSWIKKGGGKFCSQECKAKWQSQHLSGENSPHWKGGLSFEPYCSKFNNEFKEYIRDKFGRVCFLCPTTEAENGQRLSVHHVNYNKDCGCDDDETCQFVPLCVGCNSKVNINRKMWEKKIKDKMQNKLNGWYI